MVFTRPHMQFPNRTLLPKSPFFKGGLYPARSGVRINYEAL